MADLNSAISLFHEALPLIPLDDPSRATMASVFAESLYQRFRKVKDVHDLSRAIDHFSDSLNHLHPDDITRSVIAFDLARCLVIRHKFEPGNSDLDAARKQYKAAQAYLPQQLFPDESATNDLVDAFTRRAHESAEAGDIVESVGVFRQLCEGIGMAADANRSLEFLEKCKAIEEMVLQLCPKGHPEHGESLRQLAGTHDLRFRLSNNISDLDRIIELIGEALSVRTPGDPENTPEYLGSLSGLSHALYLRFKRSSKAEDFQRCIDLQEKAAMLRPNSHPGYARGLLELSGLLQIRFGTAEVKDVTDINRAIELEERVLAYSPETHPDHSEALVQLANNLYALFGLSGDISDNDRAVESMEKVVNSRPLGQDGSAGVVTSLCLSLYRRFEARGNVGDLHRGIDLSEQLLDLLPSGNPDRFATLRNLEILYAYRAKQGSVFAANRLVELGEEILSLRGPNDLDYPVHLQTLGLNLYRRFKLTGDVTDLNRSLSLAETRLAIWPPGHAKHSETLQELEAILSSRFEQGGELADLNRCIELEECTPSLVSGEDLDRIQAMMNLAKSLEIRFNRTTQSIDIDRAIELRTTTLDLIPDGHADMVTTLYNLSWSHLDRFEALMNHVDLDRAIDLGEKVLRLHPPGHANRTVSLVLVAKSTLLRDQQASNPSGDHIWGLFREASSHSASPVLDCLSAAQYWGKQAQRLSHLSRLEAHGETLRLLAIAVAQGHSLERQYLNLASIKVIQEARGVAVEAAALALDRGRPELAIRLLEQGRGVVFRQLSQLRAEVDDIQLVVPGLAETFRSLSHQLEALAVTSSQFTSSSGLRSTAKVAGAFLDDTENLASKYQEVSLQWTQVVEEIRGVYGFNSFLQPAAFLELQWAADAGPVIIVNISNLRSDAIIITREIDHAIVIPLPEASPETVTRLADRFGPRPAELDERMAIGLLRDIWDIIVKPVVDQLLGPELNLPLGSRIWWCPTGAASRLPLHAAGSYRSGERDMLHLFSSSYVASLGSLTRARRSGRRKRTGVGSIQKALVVGQADAEGERSLPETRTEVEAIKKWIPTVHILEGSAGTRETVLSGIAEHSWVHFACHGQLNPSQPFNSRFPMHDGPISLLDLVKHDLPTAEVAILSACHSAGASRDIPDEALHPAAGMMVAGFRSVVATMWALDDKVGPTFAREFYKAMSDGKGGLKGATEVSPALTQAVNALGRKGVPLMQRINLVHFGI